MRRAALFLGTLMCVLATGLVTSVNALVVGNNKALTVCVGDDGRPKIGALDVVLLMDNSKSLETKKGTPTDPDGLRFRAVRDLLVALEGVTKGSNQSKGVPINFGMISFGSRAQVEIPIQPLQDANSLADEVKTTLPEPQSHTDYVGALERAIEVLQDRPTENCKFLVWFTDGQFESEEIDSNDERRREKIAKQADQLQERVCSEGGLADQFHRARINTFVLVLRPTKTDERIDVSYGAMQAITGAFGKGNVPDEVASGKRGDLCGNIATRERIGDILVAEDASSIARKVPTIANTINDWDPVTACPVSSDDEDMPKMPAARHLARLSFTAYDSGTNLSSLDKALILKSDGTKGPFEDYLETVSSSEFEQKYKFSETAVEELNQGWTFSIPSGEVGWCVQMLPNRFEVEFYSEGSTPKVRQVSQDGRLTEEDLRQLTYKTSGGEDLRDLQEASSASEAVLAFLDIDPTDSVFAKLLPVAVRQQTVPLLDCLNPNNELALAISADEPMPKSRQMSVRCDIDTTNTTLDSVTLSIVAADSLREEACSARLDLVLTPRGEDRPDNLSPVETLEHPKGSATIHVVLTATNRSAACNAPVGSLILIEYATGQSQESLRIPIAIDVEWRKVPVWWAVAVITGMILVLVIVANLLLMRLLTRKSSLLPKFGVVAYELPVLLMKDAAGRISLRQRDGSPMSTLVIDMGRRINVNVAEDRRSAVLAAGSLSKLEVNLPPLYKPLQPAVLRVDSRLSALHWQLSGDTKGLNPVAPSGAVLHSPNRVGDDIEAVATVLWSGARPDREWFIRETLGSGVIRPLEKLATDPDWFGDSSSSRTAVSSMTQRNGQAAPLGGIQTGVNDSNPPRIQPPPPPPVNG